MVHEEFVDRQYRAPFGGGEGRTSGPTILEPAALGVSITGAATSLGELSGAAPAAAPGEQSRVRPWQAAAQAKGRPGYFLAKRCLDCSLALIAILLLSPVFLVTALLVRLTSRGPAFYRQERVGFAGRHFVMYKFRSMYVENDENLHRVAYEQFLRGERSQGKVDGGARADAKAVEEGPSDEKNAPSAKSKRAFSGDPRITRLGYTLRRSSIDELPQFFNVLRGDMSLVGPRPPIPYEVGLYHPWHMGRLDTLPGITGLWQVHGRSRVTFDQMVRMDLEYIEKQSFWYDLKLLVLTVPAVLNRKGAY